MKFNQYIWFWKASVVVPLSEVIVVLVAAGLLTIEVVVVVVVKVEAVAVSLLIIEVKEVIVGLQTTEVI